MYADDTQLYLSGKIDEIHHLTEVTVKCLNEVKQWIRINQLKLNDDKTDGILITRSKSPVNVKEITLDLNGNVIHLSSKVKNLGVIFHVDFSMDYFLSATCKNMYLQMKKDRSNKRFLFPQKSQKS